MGPPRPPTISPLASTSKDASRRDSGGQSIDDFTAALEAPDPDEHESGSEASYSTLTAGTPPVAGRASRSTSRSKSGTPPPIQISLDEKSMTRFERDLFNEIPSQVSEIPDITKDSMGFDLLLRRLVNFVSLYE